MKKCVHQDNDMCQTLENCPADNLDNGKGNKIKLEDVAQDPNYQNFGKNLGKKLKYWT